MKHKLLRRAGALLLSLALALSLAVPALADDVPVTGVMIVQSSITVNKGESEKAIAIIEPDTATNQGVVWTSYNKNIATVDENTGVVTGVAGGNTTIQVTTLSGARTATCPVTVTVPVEEITVTGGDITLLKGETADLTGRVTVKPEDATDKTVTWKSNDDNVASVRGSNLVAVGVGTTTITASVGTVTAGCTVTVEPAELREVKIEWPKRETTMVEGDSLQLTATVTYSDGVHQDAVVSWHSENPDVVEAAGSTITAKAAGSATITATVTDGGKTISDSVTVTVTAAPIKVTSITLKPENPTLKMGGVAAVEMTATINPENATNKNIIWGSSNTRVARVDINTGIVRAVSEGTATITAISAENSSIKATVIVTVLPADPSLTLASDSLSVPMNGIVTLAATLTNPPDSPTVLWTAEPAGVVELTGTSSVPEGVLGDSVSVKGVKAGKAIITAQTRDGALRATCEVTVTEAAVTDVTIVPAPGNEYMSVNENRNYRATVYPAGADQSVKWSSSDTSVLTVNDRGVVTAISPGRATISATSADGRVQANNPQVMEVTGITLDSTMTIYVDRTEQIVNKLQRYGAAARSGSVVWESSNDSIASVNTGGSLTGRYPGKATITVTVTANSVAYTGVCEVTVEEDIAGEISRTMDAGEMLSFSGMLSELNSKCQSKTGAGLQYIMNMTVPTNEGTLYYGYVSPDTPNHGIGGSERYYYRPSGDTQRGLSDITFVPAGSFSGRATISYTGYDTNNIPYNGRILVTVNSTGDVAYTTAMNRPLTFAAEDFVNICRTNTGGRTLSYVTFVQPNDTRGTLYYNYSTTGQYSQKVESATQYRASGTPSLDLVTFVPAENYSGKVSVTYRCTDTSGSTYTGAVSINVYKPDGATTADGVVYNTGMGQKVTMDRTDFDRVCREKTGYTLNYIIFDSLPASSAGTLYYDYTSSSSYDSRVNLSSRYYRGTTTPRLSLVSFVPASGYSGTVSIPYTGYDTQGNRYTDTLTINVSTRSRVIRYTTMAGQTVTFNTADFNEICQAEMGTSLNHVRFQLPNSSVGTLYYNYRSSKSNNTKVSANANYYRTGDHQIGDITFVPERGFNGVVTISYTGYASTYGGDSYTGTVEITVNTSSIGVGSYVHYTGSSTPIAFRPGDFQSACAAATGGSLSYILFTSLPGNGLGRLYTGYATPSQPGTPVFTGTPYYVSGAQSIDSMCFVPKAEYQGPVTLSYTGCDTQGRSFDGTVTISLSDSYCATPFRDMTDNWAKTSVEFLRQAGVVNGYSNNTIYGPGDSVTRGQFTLMICRAFGFSTTGGGDSFADVPAGSAYAGAVAAARNRGIVQGGTDGLFHPNSAITRQSAMTMICRAMQAAGKSVPAASATVLSPYGDNAQVSDFARSAMASLIQMGVVRGNASMRLNPGASISRAEMAVILHRVLTL